MVNYILQPIRCNIIRSSWWPACHTGTSLLLLEALVPGRPMPAACPDATPSLSKSNHGPAPSHRPTTARPSSAFAWPRPPSPRPTRALRPHFWTRRSPLTSSLSSHGQRLGAGMKHFETYCWASENTCCNILLKNDFETYCCNIQIKNDFETLAAY